jgi:hypothetical protein
MTKGLDPLSILIKKAIDDIILTTDNTVGVFERHLSVFSADSDRKNFIREFGRRLTAKLLEQTIEDHCLVYISDDDWHYDYLYGEQDAPTSEQMKYDKSHGLYHDEYELTAFENWKRRKQFELEEVKSIIKRLGYKFNVKVKMPITPIGVKTTFSNVKLRSIYDALIEANLIETITLPETFISCFSGEPMEGFPEIRWLGKSNLFYYLIDCLRDGFFENEPFISKICTGRLFVNEHGEAFSNTSMKSNLKKIENQSVQRAEIIDKIYREVIASK